MDVVVIEVVYEMMCVCCMVVVVDVEGCVKL